MKVKEFIDRARSQLGNGAKYRMGGGRITPYGRDCLDESRACDCSAFVCWCARIEKYQGHQFWWLAAINGGWLNTDGIWYDANKRVQGFFQLVAPSVGSIIVYPAKWISRLPGPKVGHTGIVTEIDSDRNVLKVIHCSSSNYRRYGDAIAETEPAVFTGRKALSYVWASSVQPDHNVRGDI